MTTYADATDKTVDTWKQGAKAMTERMEFLGTTPSLDFVEPVERYFDYLQRAVDLNRELLTRWAELASGMSGTLRDGALEAGHATDGRPDSRPGNDVRPTRDSPISRITPIRHRTSVSTDAA